MLTPAAADSMRKAYSHLVDTLGVPATWEQTKDPQETKDVVLGFKSASWRDEELINAFGIGAKVFTIKVADIPVVEKFDRITISGEKYTIDSVMPVYLNGEKLFHKAIVRGK